MKWTAKLLFPGQLLHLSDPLGGFFLLSRELLQGVTLRPIGYKILLEVLLRCPWQHIIEVPYHFRVRAHGQSKATMRQGTTALRHMLRLWYGVPAAGRAWKIGLLLCFNILIALGAFLFSSVLFALASSLTITCFALMAGLDFFILNRFILPSPVVVRSHLPVSYVEDKKYKSLSASSLAELIDAEPLELDKVLALPDRQGREYTPLPESLMPTMLPAKPKRRWLPSLPTRAIAEKATTWSAMLIIFLAVCLISYALPGALLVFAAILIGIVVLLSKRVRYDEAITMILALGVGVASIDYLSWRFVVANWHGWWIAVPLLFAEFLGGVHALGFQVTVWPWQPPTIEEREDPTKNPVYVFIPTVNEGVSILRPTLGGIIEARDKYLARYPHEKNHADARSTNTAGLVGEKPPPPNR